MPIIASIRKDY